MAEIRIEYNEDGVEALLTSDAFRQFLDQIAFTVTAHAIPHTGVDTGRLLNSMSHRVEKVGDHFEAVLGSGAGDGVEAVWYASYHWAAKPAQEADKKKELRRRRIPHPTKQAPTLPYSKAMDELGIDYEVEPGGFES